MRKMNLVSLAFGRSKKLTNLNKDLYLLRIHTKKIIYKGPLLQSLKRNLLSQ